MSAGKLLAPRCAAFCSTVPAASSRAMRPVALCPPARGLSGLAKPLLTPPLFRRGCPSSSSSSSSSTSSVFAPCCSGGRRGMTSQGGDATGSVQATKTKEWTGKIQAGIALRRQGRFTDADAMFRNAIAHGGDETLPGQPHRYLALSNLGASLRDQGKYKEAFDALDEAVAALKQNPILQGSKTFASMEQELALACVGLDRKPQALVFFTRAAEGYRRYHKGKASFDECSCQFQSAQLHMELGAFKEADKAYRKVSHDMSALLSGTTASEAHANLAEVWGAHAVCVLAEAENRSKEQLEATRKASKEQLAAGASTAASPGSPGSPEWAEAMKLFHKSIEAFELADDQRVVPVKQAFLTAIKGAGGPSRTSSQYHHGDVHPALEKELAWLRERKAEDAEEVLAQIAEVRKKYANVLQAVKQEGGAGSLADGEERVLEELVQRADQEPQAVPLNADPGRKRLVKAADTARGGTGKRFTPEELAAVHKFNQAWQSNPAMQEQAVKEMTGKELSEYPDEQTELSDDDQDDGSTNPNYQDWDKPLPKTPHPLPQQKK